MPSLANLKPVVERKSGQSLISFSIEDLRSRLGFDVGSMRKNGFDPSIIEELQAFNDRLEAALGNLDVSEYLCSLTTENIYIASGVRVLTLASIKEEIHELEPGAVLFRHGYLPIVSSIGGNIVCFHWSTSRVVWADHTVVCGDLLSFKNQATMKWEEIPFTPENISKALIPLATDLKDFLSDLLDDKFEKQFDKFD